jgi:5-oxoprolinase (ATP-hydrolysing)
VVKVAITVDQRPARATSISPAPATSSPDQFQRAGLDLPGGGALRVPHPGRRRDPDERRLPAAGRLVIPEGSMLRPRYPAAVVAGNVETSQVVVDALYGALGRDGGAQGTMNNFTFGDDRRQYYETICGGSGAGPDFDGADAVQTHMTNSRLTDPEVLETRYPVLVEAFSIRRGSGGRGAHRAATAWCGRSASASR